MEVGRMKRFKTNLLVGLQATMIGLAMTGVKYLVNDYDLMSVIIATIFILASCMGITYMLDGLSYIVRKIGGRK